MAYTVAIAPQALEQLSELYSYIAVAASPEAARLHTDAIATHHEKITVALPSRKPA